MALKDLDCINDIEFAITNTRPSGNSPAEPNCEKIGLANLRRQLTLLYPESHGLYVSESSESGSVQLTLRKMPS